MYVIISEYHIYFLTSDTMVVYGLNVKVNQKYVYITVIPLSINGTLHCLYRIHIYLSVL